MASSVMMSFSVSHNCGAATGSFDLVLMARKVVPLSVTVKKDHILIYADLIYPC